MNALCGVVRFDGGRVEPAELDPMFAALPRESAFEVELQSLGSAVFGLARYPAGAACGMALADDRLTLADGFRPEVEQEGGLGFFASACWIPGEHQLVLKRDAMGRRALYWARRGDRLWFATEPRQVLAASQADSDPDLHRLLAYLLPAAPAADRSFFRTVRRLPAGARLEARRSGERCALPNPRFPSEAAIHDLGQAAEQLRSRLATSVEASLPEVGGIGVLLSGGIDSSIIAALAARQTHRELTAFTWTGGGLDERDRSSLLLAQYPSFTEDTVEAENLWPFSRYPEAWQDTNAPYENVLPDLLWTTLERARQAGVRLLMNGLGGDNVTGWLTPEVTLLLSGRWTTLVRRGKRGILALLKQVSSLVRRQLPEWLTPWARLEARKSRLDRGLLTLSDVLTAKRFRLSQLVSPANGMFAERLDRLGRASGVRIEAPWLHARVAALALALKDGGLAAQLPMKRWAHAAAEGILPPALLESPVGRRGSPRLVTTGLLGCAKESIESLLTHSRLEQLGIIQGADVLSRYRARAERGSILPGLWRILTAEAWLRSPANA